MTQLTTTRQLTQEGKDKLESLLDGTSLSYLLSVLGEICFEKADHIQINWQDKVNADLWNDAGEFIAKISERSVITRVGL